MFNLFKRKAVEVIAPHLSEPLSEDFILTAEQGLALADMTTDGNGYVFLGDVVHGMLTGQTQYMAPHFDGNDKTTPILTEGLRADASSSSYHEYKIHKDDVVAFIARLRTYRRSVGRPCA